jgi:phosphoenolpyruvate carboxylase
VADEREHVLFYLVEILYRVVPFFYEEIETALAHAYSVPVDSLDVPSLLRFGSWVGGDMDGNADVHGKTIRETLHRHQQLIVSTYFTECGQLAETLSQSASRVTISAALAKRIEAYKRCCRGPGAGAGAARSHAVSHFLRPDRRALQATYDGRPNAYQSADELLADIQLAADSLLADRGRHAGYFLVRRLMRRVRTFGFHLATLDVIQHAHVHDEVIAQGLGVPEWPALPAAERLRQLRDLLARDQGRRAPSMLGAAQPLGVRGHRHARHKFGGAPSANTS